MTMPTAISRSATHRQPAAGEAGSGDLIPRGRTAVDTNGGPTVTIDRSVPGVRVIRVVDVLDRANAARMLRLVDTQLMLTRTGDLRLRAVVVDLSAVHRIDREGPAALTHARYTCWRLGVELALAGIPGALYATPVAVRSRLRGFSVFPTVDAAVDALATHDRGPEPDPRVTGRAGP